MQNAAPDSSLAIFGSIVTYTCTMGYKFPDNGTSATIACSVKCSGEECATSQYLWDQPMENCIGMLYIIPLLYKLSFILFF